MMPKSPIPELMTELLLSIGLLSLSLMFNDFRKSPGSVEIEKLSLLTNSARKTGTIAGTKNVHSD